ncbi:MAG: hypothetical protein JWR69_986 [Pedosphaera sp.]|nr:hypothetical protein [Pedosphaera sp.]
MSQGVSSFDENSTGERAAATFNMTNTATLPWRCRLKPLRLWPCSLAPASLLVLDRCLHLLGHLQMFLQQRQSRLRPGAQVCVGRSLGCLLE